MGENSFNTHSTPPSTKSRKEAICDSTSEGNLTSGSRNLPKYFCGRTCFVFAILQQAIHRCLRHLGVRTVIKFSYENASFDASSLCLKSATVTQSANSKCVGSIYEVFFP